MTVGGSDFVFAIPLSARGTAQQRALDFFKNHWPHCVVEMDELEEIRSASDPETTVDVADAPEIFFFSSPDAARSWNEYGATPDNSNDMVHLIVARERGAREVDAITVVVGERTPTMVQMVNDLKTALNRSI